MIPNLIFDFDSTFVQTESLETLASVALKNQSNAAHILKQMSDLTDAAMSGTMPFSQALKKKVSLLTAHRSDVDSAVRELQHQVTMSIMRNKAFFQTYAERIYIISGGFVELIWPVVKSYGIRKDHVFANELHYDYQGNVIGFNQENPLAQSGGKVKLLKKLNFDPDSIIIGDGYNDYELKESGVVKQFFAFTENIVRASVVAKADYELKSLNELFQILGLKFEKKSNHVLLLENIHPNVKKNFLSEGWEVTTHEGALNEDSLFDALEGVHALGIRSKTTVSAALIKRRPDLLAIGAFCIGTNQINLTACDEKGIAVFNAPYSNTRSVVELAISEMICLLRKIYEKSVSLHQGLWEKNATGAHEIRGKILGIVGYGNIGVQLSILAESLGMHVYYYDIAEKLPLGNAKPCKSLSSLLKISDIVSLHVDGRAENANMLSERELSLMKTGSILLNLSRGHVVNQTALALALKTEKIAGAAIDVFPDEPENNKIKFNSPLQNLRNVILTPHIGGSTEEAQANIGDFVFNRLNEYVSLGTSSTSINFPEIKLPPMAQTHRIIHIHKNVPGRLAEINALFAQQRVNIEGQYLQTKRDIGYVITDVRKDYAPAMIEALHAIEHTMRVRVLY